MKKGERRTSSNHKKPGIQEARIKPRSFCSLTSALFFFSPPHIYSLHLLRLPIRLRVWLADFIRSHAMAENHDTHTGSSFQQMSSHEPMSVSQGVSDFGSLETQP